jgi:hypothetical protein
MDNEKKHSIEELKTEYQILREKYELEFDLERMRQKQRQELLYQKEREKEEERYRLMEHDISDLLLKLEFENNQLKTNILLLERKKYEQASLPAKVGLSLSSILAIVSIAFTIIPFLKQYFNIPQIVVSISIVLFFLAVVLIYKNWSKLSLIKNKKGILSQKLVEARGLHQYITKALSNYYDQLTTQQVSNTNLE